MNSRRFGNTFNTTVSEILHSTKQRKEVYLYGSMLLALSIPAYFEPNDPGHYISFGFAGAGGLALIHSLRKKKIQDDNADVATHNHEC